MRSIPAETDEHATQDADLRSATLAGVRWVGAGRVVIEAVSFGVSVVLARLISPAAFGQAAIVIGIASFGVSLSTVVSSVVQRSDVDTRYVSTALALALALGTGLTVALFALAPLFGMLFGGGVEHLVRLSSPVFLLGAVGAVPQAILQRQLDFRRLTIMEVVGTATGLATSLALAIAGAEAEALVLGLVTTSATNSLLAWVWARPRWAGFDPANCRHLLAFGLPATASASMFVAYRYVDYALIGARSTASAVGLYWRAYQLAMEYQGKITGVMLRMAFPVYSRAAGLEEKLALRTRIVRLHAVVIFPLLALLGISANVAVPAIYGPNWSSAAAPVQILCLAAIVVVVLTGTGPLMLALGRARELSLYNLACLVTYATLIAVAAPHGLVTVCWAVVGFQVLNLVFSHLLLLGPFGGVKLQMLPLELAPAASASLALIAVAFPTILGLRAVGAPDLVTLMFASLLGGVTYLGVLRSCFRSAWGDIVLLVARVRRR